MDPLYLPTSACKIFANLQNEWNLLLLLPVACCPFMGQACWCVQGANTRPACRDNSNLRADRMWKEPSGVPSSTRTITPPSVRFLYISTTAAILASSEGRVEREKEEMARSTLVFLRLKKAEVSRREEKEELSRGGFWCLTPLFLLLSPLIAPPCLSLFVSSIIP